MAFTPGVVRGDRVAVVMPNGPEMASLFLGVASVASCAPLNAAYRSSEFEFYLSDLKPKLLIVDGAIESPVHAVRACDGYCHRNAAPRCIRRCGQL